MREKLRKALDMCSEKISERASANENYEKAKEYSENDEVNEVVSLSLQYLVRYYLRIDTFKNLL